MSDETRHLIRVGNTDIEGDNQLLYGLTQIKGVSVALANAACRQAGINTAVKAGDISEDQEEELDEIIKNPTQNGIPAWLVNRRKDPETGEDKHLLGGDIDFTEDRDIKRMKKMKSYRGVRHMQGLTVRGQRTKGNFRSEGGGLGVEKEKVEAEPDEE